MAAVISSLCVGRVRGATGTICLCGTEGDGKANMRDRGKGKYSLKQFDLFDYLKKRTWFW